MYTIREILDYMATGEPFSIQVVAYDKKRRTGGQVIDIAEAVQLREQPRKVGGRKLTRIERQRRALEPSNRAPRHGRHFTRNVRLLQQGEPTTVVKKVHIPLIIRFNGEEVVP